MFYNPFHIDPSESTGWGNTGDNVNPVNIEVDIPASGADQGNLVITLEFTPTP
jgi:hypothetical protein